MPRSFIVCVLIALACISCSVSAQADDKTFTQVGIWKCTIPPAAAINYQCPTISFPKPFDGTPQIVASYCADNIIGPVVRECVAATRFQSITAGGFTPLMDMGGNGAPPGLKPRPRPVTGSYVAVGIQAAKSNGRSADARDFEIDEERSSSVPKIGMPVVDDV